MKTSRPISDPGDPWAPYTPDADAPWDLRRVVRLHRRAGFAATWDELQRDLGGDPGAAVDRLLEGRSRPGSDPDEFARTSRAILDGVGDDTLRLRAWWVLRMLQGPDPLGERLALMWHGHFATGDQKVRDAALMLRQNETFRRLGRARFGDLLRAMARDPALLIWLDAPANRKAHPNENLARELMELFTLGVGHYAESEVKQAARALTGWSVAHGEFHYAASEHDDGEKSILGRTGRLGGDDLLEILLGHPATSERLARRLCDTFLGDGAAGAQAVSALAADMRAHDLDIGRAVGLILRSRAFHTAAGPGSRVAGPFEFVVGAARALELADPPPSTYLLAEQAAVMGQDLFHPPNVGGWKEGRSWITHQGIIARVNYIAGLVEGGLALPHRAADVAALASRHGRGGDPGAILEFASNLWLGTPTPPPLRDRILGSLPEGSEAEMARIVVALLLASPEAQLS